MTQKNKPYQLSNDALLLDRLEDNPKLKFHASNFLLYGGLLAGHSDGNLDDQEKEYLIQNLLPLYESPETIIDCIQSPEVAVASLKDSMGWLRENGNDVNSDLFRCLVGIVAADNVLDESELFFMNNIMKGLGLTQEEGTTILYGAFSVKKE